MADALTLEDDEGRGVAAISFGEVPSNLRSGDLRMGKPTGANRQYADLYGLNTDLCGIFCVSQCLVGISPRANPLN